MSFSRRQFLQNAFALGAGACLPLQSLFANKKSGFGNLVGVQLYSIRDDMWKDPKSTLQALAQMGYTHVEHAGYSKGKFYGFTAKEFRSLLDGLGIKMPSGHTVLRAEYWDETKKDFTDEWKQTVDDAALMGQEYVISPALEQAQRKDYDSLIRFLDVFNKCGELCQKQGMKFGYHNHDFEFSQILNGRSMYEWILDKTDPQLVIQQLDTGNLYNGGARALDIVKKYPGRFPSLHVKDEIKVEGQSERYESTILGKGIVNLKEVLELVKQTTPAVHYIIEQEAYQGVAPLECARQDLAVMKEWGYKY